MQHEVGTRSLADPTDTETWTSQLTLYGDPSGHSAMAKTVGIPAALATLLILDGGCKERGVIRPLGRECSVLLDQLKREGITVEENKRKGLPDYSMYS